MPNNLVTPPVRMSYLNAFVPKPNQQGKMAYSTCVLIPKSDKKTVKWFNDQIKAAKEEGLEKGSFLKSHLPGLKLPLRDGDKEIAEGKRKPNVGYEGNWFFNCNNLEPPGVFLKNGMPTTDTDQIYSGIWAKLHCNIYPFAARNEQGVVVNRGVGISFLGLLKQKDDERLDGRVASEVAFADHVEVDESSDDSAGLM